MVSENPAKLTSWGKLVVENPIIYDGFLAPSKTVVGLGISETINRKLTPKKKPSDVACGHEETGKWGDKPSWKVVKEPQVWKVKPYVSLRSTPPHPGMQIVHHQDGHALFLSFGNTEYRPRPSFATICISGKWNHSQKKNDVFFFGWWYIKPLITIKKKRWFAPTKIWKTWWPGGLLRVNQWLGCRRCDLEEMETQWQMTSCKWSWRANFLKVSRRCFLLSNEQKTLVVLGCTGDEKTLPSLCGDSSKTVIRIPIKTSNWEYFFFELKIFRRH